MKPQYLFAFLSGTLGSVVAVAEPVAPPRPPVAPPRPPETFLNRTGPTDAFLINRLRPAPPLPEKPGPFLGVVTNEVNPALRAQLGLPEGVGLVIDEVLAESPAARAGLLQHDLLKQINDQLLTAPAQLATLVRHYGKDTEVTLTLIRKGAERKVTVTIGERLMPERRTGPLRWGDPGRLWQQNIDARVRELHEREGTPLPLLSPSLKFNVGPGGGPDVKILQDQHSTTWNTASARVILKDEAGEIEVSSEQGKRTLTARNPKGETVFTGPIDTEEQRAAVPEEFRRKLDRIDVRTETEKLPPAGRPAPSGARNDPDRARPFIPLELEAMPSSESSFVQ